MTMLKVRRETEPATVKKGKERCLAEHNNVEVQPVVWEAINVWCRISETIRRLGRAYE